MTEREHEELMWVLSRIADGVDSIAESLSQTKPADPPPPDEVTHTPMSALMNTEAAARFLGRPASTLAFWRHKGIGPSHVNIGSRVFYIRDDLLGWIQAQMNGDDA